MSDELKQLWAWVVVDDDGAEAIAAMPSGRPLIGFAKENMVPLPAVLKDKRYFPPDVAMMKLVRYDRIEVVEEVELA